MIIKPQGFNVLIKTLDDEVVYKSIHLPDTAKAKSCDGIVMSVGQWCDQVKPGDHVIFSRKQAHNCEIEGEELIFVDERAVVVVIEDDE